MNSHAVDVRPSGQGASGDELFLAVRAGFVRQGTSFARWCRENNVCRPYAEQAVKGHLTFEKARALRARVMQAAGIAA